MKKAVLMIAFLLAGRIGASGGGSEYEELLKSPKRVQEVKTIGMALMALPHEKSIASEMAEQCWAASPDAELDETQKMLLLSRFKEQITRARRMVEKYSIQKLSFLGFTEVGHATCNDWYFSAVTPNGPGMFRVSSIFSKTSGKLFGIEVFSEWRAVAAERAMIEHAATKSIFSVTFTPPKEEEPKKSVEI